MWPEDFYKLSTRKVNMEKKDERQILEDVIKDAQAALDEAKKSLAELKVTYSRGDRFVRDGEKYILVATPKGANHMQFSRLSDGCYSGGCVVKDSTKITQKEMNRLMVCGTFTRYWDSQKKIYTGDSPKSKS